MVERTPHTLRFLRYPGGKRRLWPELSKTLFLHRPTMHRYVEPFVGGGSTFFFVRPSSAILSDINQELIDLYSGVRHDPEAVWEEYSSFAGTRRGYYAVRSLDPHTLLHKFTLNQLGSHYVQLFFEEAHALFPNRDQDTEEIYRRLAKEGAKYHIGMVYSTQSPSTLSRDLLAQTENFFVVHLSSEDDVNALAKVNVAYKGLGDDLMRTRTVGYVRMLTRSNRFVVPLQARKFVLPSSVSAQEAC